MLGFQFSLNFFPRLTFSVYQRMRIVKNKKYKNKNGSMILIIDPFFYAQFHID